MQIALGQRKGERKTAPPNSVRQKLLQVVFYTDDDPVANVADICPVIIIIVKVIPTDRANHHDPRAKRAAGSGFNGLQLFITICCTAFSFIREVGERPPQGPVP